VRFALERYLGDILFALDVPVRPAHQWNGRRLLVRPDTLLADKAKPL